MAKKPPVTYSDLLKDFIGVLLLVLRLTFKRFLKPYWIIFTILIIVFIKNWAGLSVVLSRLGLPEYSLIKDYLVAILSLPVAIIVIGLVFLTRFREEVKIFLKNSKPKQIGPIETESNQTQAFVTMEKKTSIPPEPLKTEADKTSEGKVEAESFEFYFLDNQTLVFNTKVALLWFFLKPNHSSTKNTFTETFILPPNILNPIVEKEAIFGALLVNELILQSENESYKVTEKGERFLKFLKLIK